MLSPQQSIALEILAAGGTRVQAAKAAEAGERTLYRWLDDPEFQEELHLRVEARTALLRPLASAQIPRTIEVLAEVRDDPATPPAVRVQACNVLLSRLAPPMPSRAEGVELDVGPNETAST